MKFVGKKYKEDIKNLKWKDTSGVMEMVERNYLPQTMKDLQVMVNSTPIALLKHMQLSFLPYPTSNKAEREDDMQQLLFRSTNLFTKKDFLNLAHKRLNKNQ